MSTSVSALNPNANLFSFYVSGMGLKNISVSPQQLSESFVREMDSMGEPAAVVGTRPDGSSEVITGPYAKTYVALKEALERVHGTDSDKAALLRTYTRQVRPLHTKIDVTA